MTSPIDQAWPEEGLERVEACPYCDSHRRTLAYKDVQDWSFNCAPGKWDYWDCEDCKSLYLDPRPTPPSIGLAYVQYYTHGNSEPPSFLYGMKARLRNESLSKTLNANIGPRLNLPSLFNGVVELIGKRVVMPFGWRLLAELPKGRFIDVGCGAGQTVDLARQLGWDAMGIEIDPAAVHAAQKTGLNILEGDYNELTKYEQQFDCIMCSHVLEHVHQPRDLLKKLQSALKPGGVLLLTLPNSLSALRRHFGTDWRGLEAPRHLCIPSEPQLIQILKNAGFTLKSLADNNTDTAAESYRIQRRGISSATEDAKKASELQISPLSFPNGNDFIKLVCYFSVDVGT
jgi:2-polyprenyl-3-methyl-5-hydroxy-6-metoxy-1,4-benzoquinol methylase